MDREPSGSLPPASAMEMDDAAPSDAAPVPQVVFRGKKRKTYRQRAADEPEKSIEETGGDTQPAMATATPVGDKDGEQRDRTAAEDQAEADEEGISVAEVLRRRNARKSRLRGVGFRPDDARGERPHGDSDDLALMIREEEQKALNQPAVDVSKRFTAQTGLVAEIVNKHMEQYIETELAKRHAGASPQPPATEAQFSEGSSNRPPLTLQSLPVKTDRHTALQGRLMEIDLGDEVRSRNALLTERATRRLQGAAEADVEEAGPANKKVRLGRDGKPWRPRNQRGSDAIQRDQLVEDIMKESRLVDVYEAPVAAEADANKEADDDGAADDRIAEEFRKEFMDAMAARRQRRRKAPAQPPRPGAKKNDDVLKGPKLGGSRNVRAAMRDKLLAKEKEKEGKR